MKYPASISSSPQSYLFFVWLEIFLQAWLQHLAENASCHVLGLKENT